MGFIGQLSALAMMVFSCIVLQAVGDARGWHLPWYFLHQVVLALVPMTFLMWTALRKAPREARLAFVATSAFFIALSAGLELVAIHNRYWWFFTEQDQMTGLRIGSIPVEEFLFYPLFLNIPILFYMHLAREVPVTTPARPLSAKARGIIHAVAGLLTVVGIGLLVRSFFVAAVPLDLAMEPVADAAGALRYAAGPDQKGWTVVQCLGLASCLAMFVKSYERLDLRRLVLVGAIYFVFTFFVELMACGRGWWVWNERQTLGIFTWVLPLDSYLMYLTGGLMPVLFYEFVRPFFAELTQQLPDRSGRTEEPRPLRIHSPGWVVSSPGAARPPGVHAR